MTSLAWVSLALLPVLYLHGALVQYQHGAGRYYEQDRNELKISHYSTNTPSATVTTRVKLYLSSGSCYFVNDVGEDNVLVISIRTHFLPLGILSESHIVAKKGVADTGKKMVSLLVEITRLESL